MLSNYSGLGSQWNAMYHVLQSKFSSDTALGDALDKTGDSFLLFHCGMKGPTTDDGTSCPFPGSCIWSDNDNGDGSNWLGMQLMLLRDRRTGWKRWQDFIEESVDTK